MVRSSIFIGLASASLAAAHFELKYPAGGFDEEAQNNGPCGGVTPEVTDDSPEITVDRFAIQAFTSHSTGSFSFFATTNTTEPYTWTEIVPNVNTTGAGDFCLQYMSIPGDWAGEQGIIQIIDTGVHGQLYQCAPVRFVEGANSTDGPTCTNGTSFEATWASATGTVGEVANTTSSTTEESETPTGAGVALKAGVGSVLALGLLAAGLTL